MERGTKGKQAIEKNSKARGRGNNGRKEIEGTEKKEERKKARQKNKGRKKGRQKAERMKERERARERARV